MKFLLKVSAHLLNLTELELDVGVENPNVGLYLKMQCAVCKELQPKMITAVPHVKWSDIKRAPINLLKCKGCTVIVAVSITSAKENSPSENELYVPLMEINSSLFKPIVGKTFHNIDLSSGEFYGYDEECGCVVSVPNLKAIFEEMDGEEGGFSSAPKRRQKK